MPLAEKVVILSLSKNLSSSVERAGYMVVPCIRRKPAGELKNSLLREDKRSLSELTSYVNDV